MRVEYIELSEINHEVVDMVGEPVNMVSGETQDGNWLNVVSVFLLEYLSLQMEPTMGSCILCKDAFLSSRLKLLAENILSKPVLNPIKLPDNQKGFCFFSASSHHANKLIFTETNNM
jgi:hypothetical protein